MRIKYFTMLQNMPIFFNFRDVATFPTDWKKIMAPNQKIISNQIKSNLVLS